MRPLTLRQRHVLSLIALGLSQSALTIVLNRHTLSVRSYYQSFKRRGLIARQTTGRQGYRLTDQGYRELNALTLVPRVA